MWACFAGELEYFNCLALHDAHRLSLVGVPSFGALISAVLQPHASHFAPLGGLSSCSSSRPCDAKLLPIFWGGVDGDSFIPRIFASRDPCSDFSLVDDGEAFGTFDEDRGGVEAAGLTPNVKPPPPISVAGAGPGAAAAGAPNMKPPPDDDDADDEPNDGAGAGAGTAAAPPKLKPPVPIDEDPTAAAAAVLLVVLAPPPPNEKPPAPMPDPPDAAEAPPLPPPLNAAASAS